MDNQLLIKFDGTEIVGVNAHFATLASLAIMVSNRELGLKHSLQKRL